MFLLFALISSLAMASPSLEQAAIIEKAASLYSPVAAAAWPGGNFAVLIKQDSELVVASASREPAEDFRLVVHKGMLESDRLTADGFRVVLCHEIGHLFGGDPLRENPFDWAGPVHPSGMSYLSGEGQSDFYSTLICFRRMVEGEDHRKALGERVVPPVVKEACDKAWDGNALGSLVCQRGALGGMNMLQLVAEFPIAFETPDRAVAARTLRGEYPSRQCRLDTYLAGAACKSEFPLDLNGVEKLGCPRPACWYQEK